MLDGFTILLAEDDDGLAVLTSKALHCNKNVKDVKRFRSGKILLDYLFSLPSIDSKHFLAILDIEMPVINGDMILKKIKHDDKLKNLPVIIFSSVDDPETINRCYLYGCCAYIPKISFSNIESLSEIDISNMLQTSDTHTDRFVA